MKLFEALLEGATTQDLLSLFESENTKRHTYMYDTSARRVNRPSGNTIPWLVLWILARFHPRRIWCGRALPSVQKFTESFNSCTNRIRWQWYFRDKEKLNFSVIVPQKETRHSAPILYHLHWNLGRRVQDFPRLANSQNVTKSHQKICRLPAKHLWSVLAQKFWHPAVLQLLRTTKMRILLQLLDTGQYFEADLSNCT